MLGYAVAQYQAPRIYTTGIALSRVVCECVSAHERVATVCPLVHSFTCSLYLNCFGTLHWFRRQIPWKFSIVVNWLIASSMRSLVILNRWCRIAVEWTHAVCTPKIRTCARPTPISTCRSLWWTLCPVSTNPTHCKCTEDQVCAANKLKEQSGYFLDLDWQR